MKISKSYLVGMAVGLCSVASVAQEASRTAYFLDGYTFRHELNPAFGGERNYVSIPVLGNINASLNSNVGVNTFLYKLPDGRLTTFMSPTVDASSFLGKLDNRNIIRGEIDMTILSAGFRAFKGYNTVSIGFRSETGLNLPKGLFSFMKLGQTGDDTRYSFSNLGVKASAMAEIALGHSRSINKKLDVGAKLKFLLGLGNIDARISKMDVRLSDKKWSVDATGEINMAAGSGLYVPTKQEAGVNYENNDMADLIEWDDIDYDSFGLSGFGMAVDLGATYQLLPDLQLSAAILDLGFINWSDNIHGRTSDKSWSFEGFRDIAVKSDTPGYEENKLGQQLDDMWDDLQDCVNFHRVSAGGSRSKMLSATINVGAEYNMPFYRQLTGGFLFTTRMAGFASWTEGRFSANVKPLKWFDASVSYGASTFGSSLGWMLNFHPKGFNFFIGSDHQFFKITPQFLPVGKANASVNLGFNVTFGS